MAVKPSSPSVRFHRRLLKTAIALGLVTFIVVGGAIVRLAPSFNALRTEHRDLPPVEALTPLPCLQAPSGTAVSFAAMADPLAVRRLLSLGWYAQLDSTVQSYEDAMPCSIHAEWNLVEAFEAFRVADTSFSAELDVWVLEQPGAAIPHLARAAYWTERAWRARGGRRVSETPRAAFVAMRAALKHARGDIDSALALNPRALIAYLLLLEHAQLGGEHAEAQQIATRGLAAWPYSFNVRRFHMRTMVPRWGGSYEVMAAYAREAQEQATHNVELTVLSGWVAWEEGLAARRQSDTGRAIARFSDAIAFGAYPPFLRDRAFSLDDAGRFRDALADVDKALALWPHYGEALLLRGQVLTHLSDDADPSNRRLLLIRALADLEQAARLDPDDYDTRDWLNHVTEQLRR
jgi:tetratricopeptide (TPR) repeat protein